MQSITSPGYDQLQRKSSWLRLVILSKYLKMKGEAQNSKGPLPSALSLRVSRGQCPKDMSAQRNPRPNAWDTQNLSGTREPCSQSHMSPQIFPQQKYSVGPNSGWHWVLWNEHTLVKISYKHIYNHNFGGLTIDLKPKDFLLTDDPVNTLQVLNVPPLWNAKTMTQYMDKIPFNNIGNELGILTNHNPLSTHGRLLECLLQWVFLCFFFFLSFFPSKGMLESFISSQEHCGCLCKSASIIWQIINVWL